MSCQSVRKVGGRQRAEGSKADFTLNFLSFGVWDFAAAITTRRTLACGFLLLAAFCLQPTTFRKAPDVTTVLHAAPADVVNRGVAVLESQV